MSTVPTTHDTRWRGGSRAVPWSVCTTVRGADGRAVCVVLVFSASSGRRWLASNVTTSSGRLPAPTAVRATAGNLHRPAATPPLPSDLQRSAARLARRREPTVLEHTAHAASLLKEREGAPNSGGPSVGRLSPALFAAARCSAKTEAQLMRTCLTSHLWPDARRSVSSA